MKAHQLGRALIELGEMLLNAPNVETSALRLSTRDGSAHSDSDELAVGLTALVALSRVDKQKWIELIRQFGFPLEVRRTESTRDVVGRLLRYLEQNPDARARLQKQGMASGRASPELMRALTVLLNE
jgi:hypothetical protein